MFACQCEAVSITGRQQIRFAVIAAVPYRAYRVNHESGRQLVAARDFGLTGAASVQGAALFEQWRAGGAVYGAIDAATAEQRGVGGVDDGVDCQRDDVRFKRLQNVAC